jgi:hypothetical protein
MEKINLSKIFIPSLFIAFFQLSIINCDLLVRSPKELKSQFISKPI